MSVLGDGSDYAITDCLVYLNEGILGCGFWLSLHRFVWVDGLNIENLICLQLISCCVVASWLVALHVRIQFIPFRRYFQLFA